MRRRLACALLAATARALASVDEAARLEGPTSYFGSPVSAATLSSGVRMAYVGASDGNKGVVYYFRSDDGGGTWTRSGALRASDEADHDKFGWAVAAGAAKG